MIPPILAAAHLERRILVTLDKDFRVHASGKGLAAALGIVRLTGFRAATAMAIHHVVTTYQQELISGSIITVDPKRIRIRAS